MRLFVALKLPKQISDYLESLQKSLPEGKMKLNKHFHLTLQFLGHTDSEKLDDIKNALKKISFEKIPIKLGKIGVFKDKKGFIKVVWASLEASETLNELQKEVQKSLKSLGFEPDKPFSPHLTLARIKYIDDEKFEQELKNIKIEPLEAKLTELILYQNHLECLKLTSH
ncbi:RNA 2',3'-cyclic phosphodiesterase [Patescibacteria group bacterium]